MCRNGTDREPGPARRLRPAALRLAAAAALTLALVLLAGPLRAQVGIAPEEPAGLLPPTAAAADGVARAAGEPLLSRRVEEALFRLQEGWIQWSTALYGEETDDAERSLDDLVADAQQLGLARLPELSVGAALEAVEGARSGDEARARLALAAAERLDPGRPETAFAAARIARRGGDLPDAVVDELRGWARVPSVRLFAGLALVDLGLGALVVVLLAGGLWFALLMAHRGRGLVADLSRLFGGSRPSLGLALVLVVLAGPLLLPAGLLWLMVVWTVLLWGTLAPGERVALTLLWLVAAASPLAVDALASRAERMVEPPLRAVDAAVEGRLYGRQLEELEPLAAELGSEPAVAHFFGDLHRKLGQWERARTHYSRVLDAEPDNVPALLALGAYFYYQDELGSAASFFGRVADTDPLEVAAPYNLSVVYGDSYAFDEANEAIARANELDAEQVSRWTRDLERERVAVYDGGFARRDEIGALVAARAAAEGGPASGDALARYAPFVLVLLMLGAAVGVDRFLAPRRAAPGTRPSAPRWLAVLMPGWRSIERRRGAVGLAALVPLVALLVLPVVGHLTVPIPWRLEPGPLVPLLIAGLGLLLLYGGRLLALRPEGGR